MNNIENGQSAAKQIFKSINLEVHRPTAIHGVEGSPSK